MSEENKTPTSPEVRIWATSTEMSNTLHQRKTYRMILNDGDTQVQFNLQVHIDGTIVAVPYVASDYNYDDMDEDEDLSEDSYDPDDYTN